MFGLIILACLIGGGAIGFLITYGFYSEIVKSLEQQLNDKSLECNSLALENKRLTDKNIQQTAELKSSRINSREAREEALKLIKEITKDQKSKKK